jgi:hypothetical protein
MRVEVEGYAGYKADERPLRFQMSGRQYQVREVLDKWYGPSDTWFKVLADDGGLYLLRLDGNAEWTLESFRAKPSPREQETAPDGSPRPSEYEP